MGVIKININTIVNYINERLAGEQLLYSQLLVFLDGTIDDINQALNSNFPAFSEFSEKDENYPDYNFFPDRYIRTVVVTGACAKFYICDEEGAAVAEQYQYEYKEKLFLMVRDYSHQVPEEYRAEHQGYMIDYTSKECNFILNGANVVMINNDNSTIFAKGRIEIKRLEGREFDIYVKIGDYKHYVGSYPQTGKDLEVFEFDIEIPKHLQNKLNANKEPVILFSGSLDKNYNPECDYDKVFFNYKVGVDI